MKTLLKGLGILLLFCLIFTNTTIAQENKKVDNAVNSFCEKVNKFIVAVETLDELSSDASYNEFKKSYNKAVKDWDKVVKAADNLENVEIKESVKAYNSLVDSVNKVEGDNASDKQAEDINNNVDNMASTLTSIMTSTCEGS